MIEYPSIINSSKAPRKHCIAFHKYDGSNIRVKYTQKKGFDLFGSRNCLIDASHPHLGEVVSVFNQTHAEPLTKLFKKLYPNEREIVVFGEFFGQTSFAGLHKDGEPKRFMMFDVMLCGKQHNKFVNPTELVKIYAKEVPTAEVVYVGNMNDELIRMARQDEFPKDEETEQYIDGTSVNEGIICKGTEKSGAFRGSIWMCKIKTQKYLDVLKKKFDKDWEKYAE